MKFEESVKRVDEIISLLEYTDVSLEDSLKLYKEGTKVINECRKKIAEAEMLVTVADTEHE